MSNLPETSSFDAGVYQIETTDPVQGGASGVTNTPLKNLVNRTRWLYDQIAAILTTIAGLATAASPTLTGSPTAPTQASGDTSTKIANDAFVANAIFGVTTKSVAGSSNVTLSAAEAGVGIIVLTGALTGNINVVFPVAGKWVVLNSTTGAYSITCKTAAGTGIVVTQAKARQLHADGTNIVDSRTDFQDAALTGAPTAPTAAQFDSTTKVASTAFVMGAKGGFSGYLSTNAGTVNLTASQVGTEIFLSLNSAQTVNLPTVASSPVGSAFSFCTYGGTANLVANGTDTINTRFGAASSMSMNQFEDIILVNAGGGSWLAASGSTLLSFTSTNSGSPFGASLGTTGYQRLPSGEIRQWGVTGSISSGGSASVTFPFTFTSAAYSPKLTISGGSLSASYSAAAGGISTGGMTINFFGGSPVSVFWEINGK